MKSRILDEYLPPPSLPSKKTPVSWCKISVECFNNFSKVIHEASRIQRDDQFDAEAFIRDQHELSEEDRNTIRSYASAHPCNDSH